MLSFFRGEDITIIRTIEGEEDEWGNPSTSETLTFVLSAVVAFQNSNSTFNNEGAAVSTDVRLIFDEGSVILEGDKFQFRGTLWERNGIIEARNPQLIANKFLPAPVVVNIKQTKGATDVQIQD